MKPVENAFGPLSDGDPCAGVGMTGDDALPRRLVDALSKAPGVTAVALGGSRARGTATATSDYDFGLYYQAGFPPSAGGLRDAMTGLVDNPDSAVVTEVGEWGPWIVGGAWLRVGGAKVDLLYRCVERVAETIAACRNGEVAMAYQPGHPHGFSSAIWMGEVALCKPLHDPDGVLAKLKALTLPYPQPLQEALIRRFQWEVRFSIENGATTLGRRDRTHVAGCAYRALCCLTQVLFALNHRYLINEKGAIAEAADFPITVPGLSERTASIWAAIGRDALHESVEALLALARDLEAAVARA